MRCVLDKRTFRCIHIGMSYSKQGWNYLVMCGDHVPHENCKPHANIFILESAPIEFLLC